MPDVEPELWEGGGRRYRMEKVVGNGAFGVVWRAVDEGTSERVAIKKVKAAPCSSMRCPCTPPLHARSAAHRLPSDPPGRWSLIGATTTASSR